MTEASNGDYTNPAAANRPPSTPEELQGRFTGLADAVLAHYERLAQTPRITKSEKVQERTIATDHYPDGSDRLTTTDTAGGVVTVETRLTLSEVVVDSFGRRVQFVTTQGPDGTTYDMRFLPSAKSGPTIYRWSADQPVGEVKGGVLRQRTEPLHSGTAQFNQASGSVEQVQERWGVLREHQRPDGSIDSRRAAASLLGTLGALVFGRRRR